MSRERDSGDRERDRRENRETERSGEREPNPGAWTGGPVDPGVRFRWSSGRIPADRGEPE
jgi:hypothetical protein